MSSNFDDVRVFHQKLQLPEAAHPTMPKADWLLGRVEMMLEELTELTRATRNKDLPEVADALIDLVYFVMGTASQLGLPWQELWDEVQRANMEKVPQLIGMGRRKNKLDVVKPPGWRSPDVAAILDLHMPVGSPSFILDDIRSSMPES